MFIDARELPDATILNADVCIVGAGAAGITIARELAGRSAQVVLLESGDFEFDAATQDLYKGANVGLPYFDLDFTRLRFFGGTTNHWSGWCRPLDPIDFEPKPWIKDIGWPFRFEELAPFYTRACSLVELSSARFDIGDWEKSKNEEGLEVRRMPLNAERFNSIVFQKSPPTRFGTVYRDDLDKAQNVKVYLNANVTELLPTASGSEIVTLNAATLNGRRFSVKPKFVVLACGGIENARLMQMSSAVERGGIGNRNDLVGRYFADHVEQVSGYAFFAQPVTPFRWYFAENSTGVIPALQLAPAVRRAHQTFGSVITLHQVPDTTEASEGFGSLRRIVRALQRGSLPDNVLGDLANIVIDVNTLAGFTYNRLTKASPQENLCVLMNRIEIRPNPDSRVTLDYQKDALGLPRAKLDWRLTDTDKATIRIAQEELSLGFGESGLGRIKTVFRESRPWPSTIQGGNHHMCTTRMSVDPRMGVVDPDCRVHGLANLWVAGSSVFPTTGTSNPTLTILALALRLAAHLKEQLA